MLISEIYESRQGEGLLTGTPSIFLRTSGCNLRCSFCDTPFTSWNAEGTPVDLATIQSRIRAFDASHVVITGGEPMLPKQMVPLSRNLADDDYHITIETAGTVFRDVACNLMSISPKLSNSTPTAERAGDWSARHESTRHRPDVVNRLISNYEYQLKFVVADPSDIPEIQEYLRQLDEYDPARVLLMPEGTDMMRLTAIGKWLADLCNRLNFVYCPRKHIEWYGNQRGT